MRINFVQKYGNIQSFGRIDAEVFNSEKLSFSSLKHKTKTKNKIKA